MSTSQTVALRPHSFTWSPLAFVAQQIERLHQFFTVEAQHETVITALIPAYEKEDGLKRTLDSLLMQTRQVNRILVVVNGPGTSDVAEHASNVYAAEFPQVEVMRLPVAGKVHALNAGYRHILQTGGTDLLLGVDADVEADCHMVESLEHDVRQCPQCLGVRARYGFRRPADTRGVSMALVSGQRMEFAMTEIRAQLRGQRTTILGGQATLFRMAALNQVAAIMPERLPWDITSKVEDAQLTRLGGTLGLEARVSPNARAWTGLMLHPHQWHSQRRKWQDGHFDDLTREFHPWHDRRRWRDQLALGWNVLLRVLFVMLLGVGLLTGSWWFSAWWLAPLGLAVVQSTLVAVRIPDRSFGEVARALTFVPGEIYYLRTLAVWIESLIVLLLNLHSDGWDKQYRAESSRQRINVSGWMVLTLAFSLPMLALLAALRYMPAIGLLAMHIGWDALTAMTVCSSISMLWLILRMLRRFRELRP